MDQTVLVKSNNYLADTHQVRTTEIVGEHYLFLLDRAGVPITDAFWSTSEDGEVWQFYIATPLRDTDGLRKLAGTFGDVFYSMTDAERGNFSFNDISVVSPEAKNVLALRQRYGTIKNNSGYLIRPNKMFFDEPFIYRLNQPVQTASESTTNA